MIKSLAKAASALGALRLLLAAAVVILVALAPFSGGQTNLETAFSFITTVLAPALFVVFVFVIPLDLTMTYVFMSAKGDSERVRYRNILWFEGALLTILILAWLPLVFNLLQLS